MPPIEHNHSRGNVCYQGVVEVHQQEEGVTHRIYATIFEIAAVATAVGQIQAHGLLEFSPVHVCGRPLGW